MDMLAAAPHTLIPPALAGSVSAPFSTPFSTPFSAPLAALVPAAGARFAAFDAWCAALQATPAGKGLVALLCLVEVALVSAVVCRVRECILPVIARDRLIARTPPERGAADGAGYVRQQAQAQAQAQACSAAATRPGPEKAPGGLA